jgi:hypothetical protein
MHRLGGVATTAALASTTGFSGRVLNAAIESLYDGNAAEVSANLRAALARQEQTKPAAWIDGSGHPRHISYVQSATERRLYGPLRPLYASPPQSKPLTDEQIMDLPAGVNNGKLSFLLRFARAIERAHKIGDDDAKL